MVVSLRGVIPIRIIIVYAPTAQAADIEHNDLYTTLQNEETTPIAK